MDTKELEVTAELAQLALSEEEKKRAAAAVDGMLGYFQRMSQVDVGGLEPTTHALQKENRTRPDLPAGRNPASPSPFNLPQNNQNNNICPSDRLLDEAPEQEDRFFAVPNVL